MKITKSQLQRIIQEELENILMEDGTVMQDMYGRDIQYIPPTGEHEVPKEYRDWTATKVPDWESFPAGTERATHEDPTGAITIRATGEQAPMRLAYVHPEERTMVHRASGSPSSASPTQSDVSGRTVPSDAPPSEETTRRREAFRTHTRRRGRR